MLYISDSDSHREHQVCDVIWHVCISPSWARNVLLVWRGIIGRGKSSLYVWFSVAFSSDFHAEHKNVISSWIVGIITFCSSFPIILSVFWINSTCEGFKSFHMHRFIRILENPYSDIENWMWPQHEIMDYQYHDIKYCVS